MSRKKGKGRLGKEGAELDIWLSSPTHMLSANISISISAVSGDQIKLNQD